MRIHERILVGVLLGTSPATQVLCGQANWALQSPTLSPSARAYGAMAYDTQHHKAVLFGGATDVQHNVYVGDTWLWDGAQWSQANPAKSPPARELHAMAYDALHQQVVLFGGLDALDDRSDTWVWDGTNWTQKSPANVPPARAFHSMAYDQARQLVVLTGGFASGGSPLGDTWVWDGTNWAKDAPAASPAANSYSAMAYDEVHQNTVRFLTTFAGGKYVPQTWIWDGTNWTLAAPVATPTARILDTCLAYLSGVQQILLFGGSDANANVELTDSWVWDGSNWTQLAPATSPSARAGYAVAYDTLNQEAVLFGGAGPNNTYLSDTWLFSPAASTTAVTINVPAGIQFNFNGSAYTGSQTINIAPGNYTLSAASPQQTGIGVQATFASWSDSGGQSHSVSVGSTALAITGAFQTQYLLSTSSSPSAGGTVIQTGPGAAGPYYNAGTLVTVTAQPAAGYTFSGWSGACSGTVNFCFVNMNAPAAATANFVQPKYPVTINVPAGIQYTLSGLPFTGSTSLSLPAGSYSLATVSPISAGVGAQTVFVSWSDGGAQSHSLVVSAAVTVTGVFKTQYLLTTLSAPANQGSTAQTGPGATGPFYDAGTLVLVTATNAPGYQFQYWSGACTGSSAACFATMVAPQTVTANFALPQTWVPFSPQNSPPARTESAMTYDAARNQTVLFGGGGGNDTWAFDGNGWNQVGLGGPPGRNYPALAFDAGIAQKVVLFGGLMQGSFELNDTWLWDGVNWTQQQPVTVPAARDSHAMAYDKARGKVVMFGGRTNPTSVLAETWVWDGANWSKVSPAHVPPARVLHSMAYDEVRGTVVMYGGLGANNTFLGDTWLWDGTDWTQQVPLSRPTPRWGQAMAYDVLHQQTILFGGQDVNNDQADTWTWDGVNWTQRTPVTSPSARAGAVMAYDVLHQQPVLFGGFGLTGALGDTWLWLAPVVNLVPKGWITSRDVSGVFTESIDLVNQGNIQLQAVIASSAVAGGVQGVFTSSQIFTNVAPGATIRFTVQFTTAAPLGSTIPVTFQGGYNSAQVTGSAWSTNARIKLQ